MNELQQAVSESLYALRVEAGFAPDDEHIHVGYFSGTPSHNKDFEIVSDALALILDRERRVPRRSATSN